MGNYRYEDRLHPVISAPLVVLVSIALVAGCRAPGGGGQPDAGADAGSDAGSSDAGGGNDGGLGPFGIGGTVTGLSGTLLLQNNGGDDLSLTANGPFTFSTLLDDGSAYLVTIVDDPVLQNCSITGDVGTLQGADVTTIAVDCIDKSWKHPSSLTDNISPASQDAYPPQVAMGNEGSALVSWVQNDAVGKRVLKSEYGAGTWTHPAGLSDFFSPDGSSAESTPPRVVMDAAGNAIIVWQQRDDTTSCGGSACRQIFKSERRLGGWTHPADVTDDISPDGEHSYAPQVAIADSGNAVIVWHQFDGTQCGRFNLACGRIFLSEYRSGSWTGPTNLLADSISPSGDRAQFPAVAIDNAGNALIVWEQSDGSTSCAGSNSCWQIFLSEYRNASWTHPSALDINISPDDQHANRATVAMSDSGGAFVTWTQSDGTSDQVYRSTYASGGWTHPSDLTTEHLGPDGSSLLSPKVALDDTGEAIMIWRQSDGGNEQLFMTEYRAGSWSTPEKISPSGTDVYGSGSNQLHGTIGMDVHGNAVIAWAQDDGTTVQIYMSEYREGSWTHPSGLSSHISVGGADASDPDVALDDDGNALIVWMQEDGLDQCSEGSCDQVFMSEFR